MRYLNNQPVKEKLIRSKIIQLSQSSFIINPIPSFQWAPINGVGYLVKEAKNEQGRWVTLEKPTEYFCGTAKRQLIIEPNQVLIDKLFRYQGDHRAECRLKFIRGTQAVYSNTFRDWIPNSLYFNRLISQ